VGEYTHETLRAFVSAGVRPQWVQLGNEITNGFLWPHGRISSADTKQWQAFVSLHNAASAAMRRVLPNALSVVHLDCGGDAERVRWWLSQAKTHGLLGVDVVGLSYYSQWHGPLSQLRKTLFVIAGENRLPVVIAETAYPWTNRTFGNDVIDVSKAPLAGFALTRAGQAAYVRKLSWILRSLPGARGIGLWWWEGFAPRMANSALVDDGGRENPALREL
jgi:arabinogalactan endo-1,4-beta-galactosidase